MKKTDNDYLYSQLSKAPTKLLASELFQASINKVVRKFVYRGMLTGAEAEDVAQELNMAFLKGKIFDVQRNYDPAYGPLVPYFEMAVYNKALDIVKQQTRKKVATESITDHFALLASSEQPFEVSASISNELQRLDTYFRLFHTKRGRLVLLSQLFARICLSDDDLLRYHPETPQRLLGELLSIFSVTYHMLADKEVYALIQPLIKLAEQKQITADALRKWMNDRIAEMITALSAGEFEYDKESLRNLMQFYHRQTHQQLVQQT